MRPVFGKGAPSGAAAPTGESSNPQRYSEIDGFRGLLVLVIYFFHAFGQYIKENGDLLFSQVLGLGYHAVEVFFVLSGFLVAKSLNGLQGDLATRLKLFWRRRFFRIYPIYFISIWVWHFFVYNLPGRVLLSQFVFGYGFLAYFGANEMPNGPTWSLFVEEVFYLLIPLIFFSLNLWRSLFLLILAIFLRLAWFKLVAVFQLANNQGFVYTAAPGNLMYLCAGVFLFFIFQNLAGTQDRKLRREIGLAWLTLAILSYWMWSEFFTLWLSTLMVYVVVLAPPLVTRVFRPGWLRWFGVRCYFIYLYHNIFFKFVPGWSGNVWGRSLLILALVMAAAELSWRLIEKPLLVYGKRPPA